MNKFRDLSKKSVHETELEILKNWDAINILKKTTKGKENFVFYDGPAFANGFPGVHHMLAKFLKDAICKYHTMQGKRILRKIGWDTHGLPIENHVEKKLGFNSKKEIEKYGLDKFNMECRKSIKENENEFNKLTKEMGQFIDIDNPYITCTNDYIETEWWILKKFYDEGLFYEGLKILPYCPRCGTGLASHEVAQGYKEITVNTVTVPFKVKDQDNTYLLIWTTTPWTLMSNVAACVNPNEKYVKCLSKGYNFIVAEKLAHKVLGDEFEVVEEYMGKDLEYLEYEQYMDILKVNKKAFYVTCADYVTMEDGTGIVHIAPAFGQDDYEVGLKYDLPVLNPVDENGCYTEGPWKGRLVVDGELEIEIIKYLASKDKIFKKQKMVHNYPHCWRCKTPLVYYSKPSYYIKVTNFKDKIIEANKTVNWYPPYVGEKRFANWLDNLNDWAISRTRYWGTPIPLWKCECGHQVMIGSVRELKEKAIENIENIDFHRPFIDEIHIKCSKCGKSMERTLEVLDCWFDSGSMPFAQYHYPFENKELWEKQYPADFIAEGIDQTRGWFYSLMVIGVFMTGKSPFKNVLVNDLLLDANGQKMHKSRGNAINPFKIIEQYGADAIRWYLPYISPVWTPIKFDEAGVKEVSSKFFSTLKNTYNFFAMYANIDSIDPKEYNIEYKDLEEIDKWLISKYNKLVKKVTNYMDSYDLTNTVREIQNFVVEDLSNWYIRRNRRRFWASDNDTSKLAVYQVTYNVLVGVCELIAPIAPFTSDEIYTKLTGKESVHLADYPKFDEKLINEKIEVRMDLVRDLISLGRNIRDEVKIKVRQPLSEALIDAKNEKLISDLIDLIKEELNVKEVKFIKDVENYMNFKVLPNFREVGKIFGPLIKDFQTKLNDLSMEDISKLQNNETLKMQLGDKEFEITSSMVEVRTTSKEGFDVATNANNFIILNTELTNDLVMEGIARELVSKVQNLRKNKGFDIADRITLYYNGDDEVTEAVTKFDEFIKNETLSLDIVVKFNLPEEVDLNGHTTYIDIEKRVLCQIVLVNNKFDK